MSVMDELGEIYINPKEIDVMWRIRYFFSLLRKDGICYTSPEFYLADDAWCIYICPIGDKSEDTDGFIDLFLFRKNSGPPISLEFSFQLITVDGKKDREKHFTQFYDDFSGICKIPRFISRFELLERRSELVPDDILTVVCTLKYSSLNENSRSEKLPTDLKEMMLSGDNSDTTIRVKGKEFQLHRNILGARNPVFNSMFKSDMKENITGVVSIDDCEPDAFHSFIHFMYTGKVDNLSGGNVCDLYALADKYQEDQLKEECLEFMINNIDYHTFFDFAVLALKHDEKKLFQSATGFFCAKVKLIIRSKEWETFLRQYPLQANKLYIKAADHFDLITSIQESSIY